MSDGQGRDVKLVLIFAEAYSYLPEWLISRWKAFDKGVYPLWKESLLITTLATPMLTAIAAVSLPFFASLLLGWFYPITAAEMIDMFEGFNFERAFGLLIFPLIAVFVFICASQTTRIKLLQKKYRDAVLELAALHGHDQSTTRTKDGELKR